MKSVSKVLAVATVAVLGVASAPAMAANIVTNGGFESGSTGWTITGSNVNGGSCDTGWTIGTTGSATGCSTVAAPVGTRAAYNSFDGNGPQTFTLSQSLTLGSVGAATLSWLDSFSSNYSGTARTFDINLVGIASSVNLYHYVLPTSSNSSSFTSHSLNVGSALAAFSGQTVSLQFVATIPNTFTGPAGFGLDNVALDVTGGAVPEPATWAMMLLGFGVVGAAMRKRRQAVTTSVTYA